MIKNFETVCKTYKDGMIKEADAETVLDILKCTDAPMRCKEIAEISSSWYGTKHMHKSNPQYISKVMKKLVALGLVEKIVVDDEPIEVDKIVWISDKKDTKPIHIVVDGVTYERIDHYRLRSGHWDTEKVTVTPHHAEFVLAK